MKPLTLTQPFTIERLGEMLTLVHKVLTAHPDSVRWCLQAQAAKEG